MRYGRGVSTDQGRTWEKVGGLDMLLACGREQILDEMQRSLGVASGLRRFFSTQFGEKRIRHALKLYIE